MPIRDLDRLISPPADRRDAAFDLNFMADPVLTAKLPVSDQKTQNRLPVEKHGEDMGDQRGQQCKRERHMHKQPELQ